MTVLGWVLFVWAFGALTVSVRTSHWHPDEVLTLAVWPLIPAGWLLRSWTRRRRACRLCGRRFGDQFPHDCEGQT